MIDSYYKGFAVLGLQKVFKKNELSKKEKKEIIEFYMNAQITSPNNSTDFKSIIFSLKFLSSLNIKIFLKFIIKNLFNSIHNFLKCF